MRRSRPCVSGARQGVGTMMCSVKYDSAKPDQAVPVVARAVGMIEPLDTTGLILGRVGRARKDRRAILDTFSSMKVNARYGRTDPADGTPLLSTDVGVMGWMPMGADGLRRGRQTIRTRTADRRRARHLLHLQRSRGAPSTRGRGVARLPRGPSRWHRPDVDRQGGAERRLRSSGRVGRGRPAPPP